MNNVLFRGIMDGVVIDRIVRNHPYSMPVKHFHKEFEIYYLLDGSRKYSIENESYTISKGCLVLINRFQMHRTYPSENPYHDRISIELDEEPFAPFLMQAAKISLSQFFFDYSGVIMLRPKAQNYVERILFDIGGELKERPPYYEAAVMLKLSELILFITRQKMSPQCAPADIGSDTTKYTKVHEVAEYIANYCGSSLSLTSLSKRFFVSKPYLSRIFKEVTGCTVHEYINIYRIKQAQDMLANTDKTVTEIAETLHYDSVTYFGRIFKKFMETSPLQYRKKFRLATQKARERKKEKEPD